MDELKKQAEELGIKVDGRWSAERLQTEIDEKLAEDPEPVPSEADSPVEDLPEAPEEPEVEVPAPVEEPIVEVVAPTEAVDPEPEPEPDSPEEGEIIVRNLQANPMKALGLVSYGEATFAQSDLARDPQLVKKLERAELLGLVKIEGK